MKYILIEIVIINQFWLVHVSQSHNDYAENYSTQITGDMTKHNTARFGMVSDAIATGKRCVCVCKNNVKRKSVALVFRILYQVGLVCCERTQ